MEELRKAEKLGVEYEKEEEEKLIEGVAVLDFDVLCSTVAMQSQGKWRLFENEVEDDEASVVGNGVLRMWEGEVLDCFDDHRVAFQSFCCPCYRFGKNMKRAGLGSCFVQITEAKPNLMLLGALFLLLTVSAFFSSIAFRVTRRHSFLYLAVASTISVATYLGFFRTQMRKKFNIKGTDSSLDDCVYHLVSPCTISQESRTLEMNNVQRGTWHGRGDTLCVGTFGEGAKAFVELHPPSLVSIQLQDEPKLTTRNEGDNNC